MPNTNWRLIEATATERYGKGGIYVGDRIILHSDCNCFYASVEMLHNPMLRDVPMAVGGDVEARHGIVLTANYIAKRMGVSVKKLEEWNKIDDPNFLMVGQPLKVKF